MAILPKEQLRASMLHYVELTGARFLKKIGLTPNGVTLIGFMVSLVAAYLIGCGWLLAAGLVVLLGGAMDLMDGSLARLTGRTSLFGALLDSTCDRLAEAVLFVGLGFYFVRLNNGRYGMDSDGYLLLGISTLLLAFTFSQGVSYLRARGEGLGVFIRNGLMTRPERVVLLGIGLMIDQITWALLVIAIVSCFTFFQRLFAIRQVLSRAER
jgi:CDP-diacylglycerol--glycerol-3-phosphate 3-phosphatidyltransferase